MQFCLILCALQCSVDIFPKNKIGNINHGLKNQWSAIKKFCKLYKQKFSTFAFVSTDSHYHLPFPHKKTALIKVISETHVIQSNGHHLSSINLPLQKYSLHLAHWYHMLPVFLPPHLPIILILSNSHIFSAFVFWLTHFSLEWLWMFCI